MRKSNILDEHTQQQIHNLSISMATKLAADAPPNPMRPQNLEEQYLQDTLEKQIVTFFETYVEGLKELMASLIQFQHTQPDLDLGELFTEFDKLDKGFNKLGESPDDTRSLREMSGISSNAISAFDMVVSSLYEKQEFNRAIKIYSFLSFLEPYQAAYWIGYGNCEFFQKQYEKAVPAYEMAIQLNGLNPMPHFYLAHCYHELHQREEAIEAVDHALTLIKDNPEMKNWLDQAQQLKEYFNQMAMKP